MNFELVHFHRPRTQDAKKRRKRRRREGLMVCCVALFCFGRCSKKGARVHFYYGVVGRLQLFSVVSLQSGLKSDVLGHDVNQDSDVSSQTAPFVSMTNWANCRATTLAQETDVTSQEHLVQMLRKRGPCEERQRQPNDSTGKGRWHRGSCSEKNR